MKNTYKRIKNSMFVVILFFIPCLFGVFMIGCNEEKDIYEPPKNCDAVLEYTSYYWTDECKDFIEICNTYDEFKEVCLRNGYGSYESEQVSEYIAEHPDKSLVVCAFAEGSYLGPYRIKEVETVDGKLTLYINDALEGQGHVVTETVMNSTILVAGIDKSVASEITELSYVVN